MNKKLLLTFIAAGTFFLSAFSAADMSIITRTILRWHRFEQEINPFEMHGINVPCVQEKIDTKLLVSHWNACNEYAKCGTPFEQEGKSQSYIDNGPCKEQYQNVMKFHEVMRATMKGCAVSTKGQEKLGSDWFRIVSKDKDK